METRCETRHARQETYFVETRCETRHARRETYQLWLRNAKGSIIRYVLEAMMRNVTCQTRLVPLIHELIRAILLWFYGKNTVLRQFNTGYLVFQRDIKLLAALGASFYPNTTRPVKRETRNFTRDTRHATRETYYGDAMRDATRQTRDVFCGDALRNATRQTRDVLVMVAKCERLYYTVRSRGYDAKRDVPDTTCTSYTRANTSYFTVVLRKKYCSMLV